MVIDPHTTSPHGHEAGAWGGLDFPTVRVDLTTPSAAELQRSLTALSSDDAVRDLLYVTCTPGPRKVRLSSVLSLDGVFEAHTVTFTTEDGPALRPHAPFDVTTAADPHVHGETREDAPGAESLVPLDTLPGVRDAVDRVYEDARRAAAAQLADLKDAPVRTVSGVEYAADRTGAVTAMFFFDPLQPPAESGAEHHLWHYSPELDELAEALAPESWWEKRLEDIQTLIGRFRSRP